MADREGLVHLYTGPGKGKTTAALGLALRAVGQGLGVFVVQFAKAEDVAAGELVSARSVPGLKIVRFGTSATWGGLMPARRLPPEASEATHAAFECAREATDSGSWDVVVLDEICVVVALGLLAEEAVLELVAARPTDVELVLTGRDATPALIEKCDLVTRMVDVRHPAERGLTARRGIDY